MPARGFPGIDSDSGHVSLVLHRYVAVSARQDTAFFISRLFRLHLLLFYR